MQKRRIHRRERRRPGGTAPKAPYSFGHAARVTLMGAAPQWHVVGTCGAMRASYPDGMGTTWPHVRARRAHVRCATKLPVLCWVISNPNRLAALRNAASQPGRKRSCNSIMIACVLFIQSKSPVSKISLSAPSMSSLRRSILSKPHSVIIAERVSPRIVVHWPSADLIWKAQGSSCSFPMMTDSGLCHTAA